MYVYEYVYVYAYVYMCANARSSTSNFARCGSERKGLNRCEKIELRIGY